MNAEKHFADLRAQTLEDAKRDNQRVPTRLEEEAIGLLGRVMRELAPSLTAIFERLQTSYRVVRTEAILGELKEGRDYRSPRCLP